MALTDAEFDRLHDLMLIQFQSLHLEIPDVVMTYAPLQKWNEYDPRLVVDHCRFKNPAVEVCYPVMQHDTNNIIAIRTDIDAAFIENEFGIEEPVTGDLVPAEKIEMVFVPLLAFDEQGNRVGYGKGYYDRFLSQTNTSTIKIGFSFFTASPEIIETDEWDIPLDICITPLHNYIF